MSINLLHNKLEETNPQSQENLSLQKNDSKVEESRQKVGSSFKSNGNGYKNGNEKNGKDKKEDKNLKKDENSSGDDAKKKSKKEERKERKRRKKKEKELEELKTLEINLVKETIAIRFDWKRGLSILIIFISFSIFIVFEAYSFLHWFSGQSGTVSNLSEQRVVDINQELSEVKLEAVDALIFKERLNLINYMFEKHIYWSNFFSMLESNTTNKIHFTGFKGDTSGHYTIPSRADEFMAIGTQVRTMARDDDILSVSVVYGELEETSEAKEGEEPEVPGVFFDLNISVDPNIFFN